MKKITLKEAKAIVGKYEDIADFLVNAPEEERLKVFYKVA